MSSSNKGSELIEPPKASSNTFLDFPAVDNFEHFDADIAILGIPYGMPYYTDSMANDQSCAPDAIRQFPVDGDIFYSRNHYDFDLGGTLLDDRDIKVVDCGNVRSDKADHKQHYRNAEQAAREIFRHNTTLISLGGDHGIPIPVLRALEVFGQEITLVHVDAHLDWRDEINGETEGYSSPIRRAAEMPWIGDIIQIGMRGIGSARPQEVSDALAHGVKIFDAYQMHAIGMGAILDQIPNDKPYYLTIDADGIDPTIMPAVIAQTPGGLNWIQIHQLIHGLVNKNRVLGMDLVEIAPSYDVGNTTMIHAERLICNFIGACVRADYYG